MTNGKKSSNLVKSHELICHFIRLYLVPLLPYIKSKHELGILASKWTFWCKTSSLKKTCHWLWKFKKKDLFWDRFILLYETRAQNLWLLFPIALILPLSSCHEKVIKWQLFLFQMRYLVKKFIWVKYGTVFTQIMIFSLKKVVDLRARRREREEKGTTNSTPIWPLT